MNESQKTSLAKNQMPQKAEEIGNDAVIQSLDSDKETASENEEEIPLQANKKPDINLTPHRGHRKGENRTERQKAATAKMKEAQALKIQQRKEQKALEEEQRKKDLEEKILKKAISIKKKQIKEQLVLDEISDDDTPIEELLPPKRKAPVVRKQIVQQAPVAAPVSAPPKQKIIFM